MTIDDNPEEDMTIIPIMLNDLTLEVVVVFLLPLTVIPRPSLAAIFHFQEISNR